MSRYPLTSLGEVLTPVADVVPVEPTATYHTAGIYSFGKGIFEKPVITGAETRYKQFIRLHEGDFTYSRLFGWEGAVAVVDEKHDGLLVSQEFPTFSINRTRAVPEYLASLCLWTGFHDA